MKNVVLIVLVIIIVLVSIGCQDKVVLANIKELYAEPAQNGIFVNWKPSNGANCYYVYRAKHSEESYSYWGITEKTEFIDITVLEGELYSYRIYPAIRAEDRYYRGENYENTEYVLALTKPVISSLQVSKEHCIIRWDPIKSAQQYSVYRSAEGESEYHKIADTDFNFYIDASYDSSKDYNYIVRMSSRFNEELYYSAPSDAITVYRVPEITSAVREDKFTAVLAWEDVADGAQYLVYRSTDLYGKYELLATTSETVYRDTTADYQSEQTSDTTVDSTMIDDAQTQVSDYTGTNQILNEHKEYYYKIQVYLNNQETLSYTTLSQSAMLDSTAATSQLFVAEYFDFVSNNEVANISLNEIYADEFEQDILYLKTEGYNTVTSHEVLDYINNIAPLPEKAIMITIDDARYGVYKYAYPLLKKYGMKAVISVVGKYADSEQSGNKAIREYCNWDEISEMAASGCFELASGGYYLVDNHETIDSKRNGVLRFSHETIDQYKALLSYDIETINDKIFSITGKAPVIFTYPHALRNIESDNILITDFGYKLLLGDNDSRRTRMNHFIDDAIPNTQLLLINRRSRLQGTALEKYILAAQRFDNISKDN